MAYDKVKNLVYQENIKILKATGRPAGLVLIGEGPLREDLVKEACKAMYWSGMATGYGALTVELICQYLNVPRVEYINWSDQIIVLPRGWGLIPLSPYFVDFDPINEKTTDELMKEIQKILTVLRYRSA